MNRLLVSVLSAVVILLSSCSKEESAGLLPSAASITSYYISSTGNDANDGHTPETAWRTIAKLNSVKLLPGQTVLFRAGETFSGTIEISRESGTENAPVTIGSYGGSKATINAGSSNSGIIAHNSSNITIRDLIIKGDGYTINHANGVFFYTDSAVMMNNIVIKNVEISGFMGRGLFFSVPYPEETIISGGQRPTPGSSKAGYNNVLIEGVEAHDNGVAGIETGGYWDVNGNNWFSYYNHKNITIRNCKAYNNRGVSNYTDQVSGSGILLGSCDGALIEYCEAWNNGGQNGMWAAGPIGIWFGEVKNGIIQYCESHHNKGGSGYDGGGFDIDGGSQHCIMQYNYSHHNAGGGLCVYEWGSGNTMSDITVRYNISENDGLEYDYAGITLWSVHTIDNINIHNNTVFVSSWNQSNTTAMNTVKIFDEQEFTNLRFFNNILMADGPDTRILYGKVGTGQWENNIYWTINGATIDGFTYGTYTDPKLTSPGKNGTVDPNSRINTNTNVLGYAPTSGSPAINKAITLGIPLGPMDILGKALPSGGSYDIGAIEY